MKLTAFKILATRKYFSALVCGILLLLVVSVALCAAEETEWPQFRGPRGDGTSKASAPPVRWAEEENVKWKTAIQNDHHRKCKAFLQRCRDAVLSKRQGFRLVALGSRRFRARFFAEVVSPRSERVPICGVTARIDAVDEQQMQFTADRA